MDRRGLRVCALAVLAASLSACASEETTTYLPSPSGRSLAVETPRKPSQCVPFVREHSAVKLYGDAWTWWDKAAGRFGRTSRPEEGAVLVLAGYAGPERAHLAVVRKVVSAREIRVDHANWLNDGAIYLDDPVADVSAANDWSQVKVWNMKTNAWGLRVYPVQGFILPGPARYDSDLVAAAAPPRTLE